MRVSSPYSVPPIALYRKGILELFAMLRTIQENPREHAVLVFQVQQILIRKIVYIEKRVRLLKSTVSELKKQRLPSQVPIEPTTQGHRIKDRLRHTYARIDRYQELLVLFRQIGDSLAYLYIDKYDIKPLAIKPAPGAISGKKGTRLERRVLRWAGANNVIAIMNDLTNCLRHGDITVPSSDGTFLLMEMKSRRRHSQREARQVGAASDIIQFLRDDASQNLHGKYNAHRMAPNSEEINYAGLLSDSVASLTQNETRIVVAEDGLAYIVWCGEWDFAIAQAQLEDWTPVAFILDPYKWPPGHTPLPLSLTVPHFLLHIYEGRAGIITVIDAKVLSRLARSEGFRVVPPLNIEDDMYLRFEPIDETTSGLNPFEVGATFWRRLGTEFLGLHWMVHALVELHTNVLAGMEQ